MVGGDVLDLATVTEAVRGQDAVLDTLGGHTPWKETTLETNGARTVIAAMRATGVKRLLIVSSIGEGDSTANAHAWYEKLIMTTFLRGVMKDKASMESAVELPMTSTGSSFVRPGCGMVSPGRSCGHAGRRGEGHLYHPR